LEKKMGRGDKRSTRTRWKERTNKQKREKNFVSKPCTRKAVNRREGLTRRASFHGHVGDVDFFLGALPLGLDVPQQALQLHWKPVYPVGSGLRV
jgi:hypothetical protein